MSRMPRRLQALLALMHLSAVITVYSLCQSGSGELSSLKLGTLALTVALYCLTTVSVSLRHHDAWLFLVALYTVCPFLFLPLWLFDGPVGVHTAVLNRLLVDQYWLFSLAKWLHLIGFAALCSRASRSYFGIERFPFTKFCVTVVLTTTVWLTHLGDYRLEAERSERRTKHERDAL